jgi:hypothetical protein
MNRELAMRQVHGPVTGEIAEFEAQRAVAMPCRD